MTRLNSLAWWKTGIIEGALKKGEVQNKEQKAEGKGMSELHILVDKQRPYSVE
jgi:hypothetical protein